MRQQRAGAGAGRAAAASATAPLAAPTPCCGHRRRGDLARAAALPEDFMKAMRSIFDYSSWAPKSSRIWRLNQYQYPEADSILRGAAPLGGGAGGEEEQAAMTQEDMRVLQERLSRLQRQGGGSDGGGGGGGGAAPEAAGAAARSFSEAPDGELASALGRRVSEIATATGEWGASVDEEAMRRPLSGEEVQALLMSKWGRLYDLSFVKRSLPGKEFVSLNVLWLYRGQRSFKLTREQYDEKVDSIAALVNALGQTDKVRAFLSAPAKGKNGLPSRPVVGTAVSIRLELNAAQIREWFGSGYD
ncbi:hypothetical protein Rsub_06395 [Raphidocelis subcapitata]|uniref:Uncharacterized protein n=1 Tax=Raphidocelis subcapitata TaxID=307507 RepID=A0A2V0P871_9CHLO|nr:hypothetical protein Rsub_06395 [Raphidocelis subcapitata]|eukprot:GBF93357.1 hypothetical protein Rsub_06395 [Raphidocelis subcapitata]